MLSCVSHFSSFGVCVNVLVFVIQVLPKMTSHVVSDIDHILGNRPYSKKDYRSQTRLVDHQYVNRYLPKHPATLDPLTGGSCPWPHLFLSPMGVRPASDHFSLTRQPCYVQTAHCTSLFKTSAPVGSATFISGGDQIQPRRATAFHTTSQIQILCPEPRRR